MNRRHFHKMALASAASSATLPLASTASSAPAVAARGAYPFAVAMAKARGAVSAAVLRDGLKVSPVAAEALLGQMRVRGVIGPVGRDGMARAAEPIFRAGVAPGQRRPGVWPRLAVQIRRATARYQGAGRAALS